MSSLIPHDYRYKISSPTPVDKEPKIKVIKRIAFGYRSFYHFKSRILMIQNLTKPKLKILAA